MRFCGYSATINWSAMVIVYARGNFAFEPLKFKCAQFDQKEWLIDIPRSKWRVHQCGENGL